MIETTQFGKKFKHIQPYYSKTSVEINNLIAVLIANGAGFGIRRMAVISDMNLNELISTNQNFFRLNTLREANDLVVNQIAKTGIFKFYTLSEYGIHASVDGQKVETKSHTIKARYSKKYFGLGKGVVSIKLVANHVPINDKIIMSLNMLDYIDDPDMRSNVHRSLNRGEALHQLISAIRKVSDKKLPGKNEIEMEMNNECTRLIANCIIYYNAKLLSDLYDTCAYEDPQAFCDLIKRLSPVAWQHINLIGKYEFCKNQIAVNIQELIETALLNSEINFASQRQA